MVYTNIEIKARCKNPDNIRVILRAHKAVFKGTDHQIDTEHRSHGPLSRDDRYIINVGSIGQPRDGNPDLSFGIFDTKEWAYEHIRAPYNIDATAKKIIQAGLPYVLAERLYEGT